MHEFAMYAMQSHCSCASPRAHATGVISGVVLIGKGPSTIACPSPRLDTSLRVPAAAGGAASDMSRGPRSPRLCGEEGPANADVGGRAQGGRVAAGTPAALRRDTKPGPPRVVDGLIATARGAR